MNWRPMPSDLPERDWRIFRKLRQKALDLYYARVLAGIAAVIADTSKSNHDRYLELHRLIRARERDLAHAFDRMTRAHAMFELCSIAQLNLLTDEGAVTVQPADTRQPAERVPSGRAHATRLERVPMRIIDPACIFLRPERSAPA